MVRALHLPSLETFETAHAIGVESAAAWGVPLARVVVECERTNAAGALWVAHVRGPGVVWCEWGADRTEALTHLCDAVRERADAAPAPDLLADLGTPFADVVELHPAPSLAECLAHQLLTHDPADVLAAMERYLVQSATRAQSELAVALHTSAAASIATLRTERLR